MISERRGSRRKPVLLAGGKDGRYGLFDPEADDLTGDWPTTLWGPRRVTLLMGRITDPTLDYKDEPWVVPVNADEQALLELWLNNFRYMDQALAVLDKRGLFGPLMDIEQAPSTQGLPQVPVGANQSLVVVLDPLITTWEITMDDEGQPVKARRLRVSLELSQAHAALAAGINAATRLEAQLAALP